MDINAELKLFIYVESTHVKVAVFAPAACAETNATGSHELNGSLNGRGGVRNTAIAAHHAVVAAVAWVVQCVWRCHDPRIGFVVVPIVRKETIFEVNRRYAYIPPP